MKNGSGISLFNRIQAKVFVGADVDCSIVQARTASSKHRNSAPASRPRRNGRRSWVLSAFLLVGLLALPIWALLPAASLFGWLHLAGLLTLVSSITALLLRADKRYAKAGQPRIPEARLHLCELMGGWAASYLTQRAIRHKTAKGSYQLRFWLIVGLYQYLALDSLQQWEWSRQAVAAARLYLGT